MSKDVEAAYKRLSKGVLVVQRSTATAYLQHGAVKTAVGYAVAVVLSDDPRLEYDCYESTPLRAVYRACKGNRPQRR